MGYVGKYGRPRRVRKLGFACKCGASLLRREFTHPTPFVDARGRGLPQLKRAPGLSAELRDSHKEILSRRNSVYAHTDETPLRQILLQLADPGDRAAWVRDQGDLSEQWFPPTREMLDDVVALAVAHLESFLAAIEEVRALILATEERLSAQPSSAR